MKNSVIYTLLVAGLGINLLVGAQIFSQSAPALEKEDPYPHLKLFSVVLERVRQDYVDGDKVAYPDLIQSALKGMLSTLDPHSEFMDTNKFQELKKDTEGQFGGVGIVISVKDNWITVVAPMEDSPGYKAGVLPGDRIIKIEGKSAEKMPSQEAVGRLRGKPGTKIGITIMRPSSGMVKEITLTREVINVPTVRDINDKRDFNVDSSKIGYVRLVQFGEQTAGDLEEAMKKLKKQGMQSMILDLRGNPGGLLDTAVQVVEMFVPRGTLIVTTEGRGATPKSEYRAKGGSKYNNLPMVVLVNGGSASASEIVSGALQDLTAKGNCRAIILGEQTFGKGSVQSILPLPNGAALRLTTAKYYTPSHKVIHEKGITPDIIVPMNDSDEYDLMIKRSPGGIESLDEKDKERIRNVRDGQLERAMDLLKGLSIYTERNPEPEKTGKTGKLAAK